MEIKPLIVVKAFDVVRAPSVCSARWTAEDWSKVTTRRCEPLVIDSLGFVWTAVNARDERGSLLYEPHKPCKKS